VDVVILAGLFHEPAAGPFHGVGIVMTEHPPIAPVMQGQLIADAVGPRPVRIDQPDPAFHPSTVLQHQGQAVQIQQGVEGVVTFGRHG
jgi:hypothetical protein